MADNFKNGGAPDRSRVSMNNLHDVRYWTQTLGCSSDELAAAVARVGNSSDAVRREVYRAWAYGTFPLGAPKTEAQNGGYEDDRASTEKRLGVLDTLSQSYGAARPGDAL
jgi:Protein of unknown function (DUF3606)